MSCRYSPFKFKKNLLASLIGAALLPHAAMAQFDFAQMPPGTAQPYVAPNVILSLDDSTSMQGMDMWINGKRYSREKVLSDALIEVFSDKQLLPDGKIRLAWQSLAMAYWDTPTRNGTGRNAIPCTTVPGLTFSRLLANRRTANSMAVLTGEHRANFISYATKFRSCTNTPTPYVTQMADQYMRATLNKNGPWADIPGEKLADVQNGNKPLGCRRNYHILLTDGDWNTSWDWNTNPVRIADASRFLPNGVQYNVNLANARIYRTSIDNRQESSTVADWAFKSWADPLQPPSALYSAPTLTASYVKAPDKETIKNRVTGTTATLEKFWNPKYNPATWPHMTTFTIGFSNDSRPKYNYTSSCSVGGYGENNQRCVKKITDPSNNLPYGDDGSLADYANGTYQWRVAGSTDWGPNDADRGQDMWRAALVSRGGFYSVTKPEDLKEAFRKIIETISVEVEPARSAVAASGSNATRQAVGIYTASYDPAAGWSGSIAAEMLDTDGSTKAFEAWEGKNTAEKLDERDPNQRVVLSAKTTPYLDKTEAIAFRWSSFDADNDDEADALLKTGDAAGPGTSADVKSGANRVNYLRGSREYEGNGFRQRNSIHGDIVNSDIWYTGAPANIHNFAQEGYAKFAQEMAKREAMIYVGANDGMLHGFSATTGQERIAYVPNGVIRNGLVRLANPTFDDNHRYFVDGSPMTGDVKDGNKWKTMLVGTLGAGGRGYFVLDVTDPTQFKESNAKNLVVKDMTLPDEVNNEEKGLGLLGHIFAKPVLDDDDPQRTVQIAQLNNGRWAVIMGNGYGSPVGEAALLIQYLDGDKELELIEAYLPIPIDSRPGDRLPNGLSAPRLVDINGDGRPDVVYAGDLQGNVWKFLINTADSSEWAVAKWSNNDTYNDVPLFQAQRGTGYSADNVNSIKSTAQAIFAAPSVKANDRSMTVTEGRTTTVVPVGGLMVSFGTGRNVTRRDPQEEQKQTLYSVLDNTRYRLEMENGKATGRVEVCMDDEEVCAALVKSAKDLPRTVKQSDLLQRRISDTADYQRASDKKDFWTVGGEKLDWNQHKGWYMDFPLSRERLLKHMSFYDGSNVLQVFSQIPSKGANNMANVESCDSATPDAEKQYVTLINIQDGEPPREELVNRGGSAGPAGVILTRFEVTPGGITPTILRKADGKEVMRIRGKDPLGNVVNEETRRMPETPLRPNWRQLN